MFHLLFLQISKDGNSNQICKVEFPSIQTNVDKNEYGVKDYEESFIDINWEIKVIVLCENKISATLFEMLAENNIFKAIHNSFSSPKMFHSLDLSTSFMLVLRTNERCSHSQNRWFVLTLVTILTRALCSCEHLQRRHRASCFCAWSINIEPSGLMALEKMLVSWRWPATTARFYKIMANRWRKSVER